MGPSTQGKPSLKSEILDFWFRNNLAQMPRFSSSKSLHPNKQCLGLYLAELAFCYSVADPDLAGPDVLNSIWQSLVLRSESVHRFVRTTSTDKPKTKEKKAGNNRDLKTFF